MATTGLVNIGALATGILATPRVEAEALLVEDGRIAAIGAASRVGASGADVVVDCQGTTVLPGLIDSHCHVVLGDYTPRQKTVDFLDSYVHGGITSVVSAGYYLYVVMVMFMRPRGENAAPVGPTQGWTRSVIAIAAILILILGVLPNSVARWTQRSHNSVPVAAATAPGVAASIVR